MRQNMNKILFVLIILSCFYSIQIDGLFLILFLEKLSLILFFLFVIMDIPKLETTVMRKAMFVTLASLSVISTSAVTYTGATNNINKYLSQVEQNILLIEKVEEQMIFDLYAIQLGEKNLVEFRANLGTIKELAESLKEIKLYITNRFLSYNEYVNYKAGLKSIDNQVNDYQKYLHTMFQQSNYSHNSETRIAVQQMRKYYVKSSEQSVFYSVVYDIKPNAYLYYMGNIMQFILKILFMLYFARKFFKRNQLQNYYNAINQ
ncbi:MAG: hypothetical protein CFH44_01100 [Proteobacteria bacterium]|nr:MAG: hypothetical protein CFH44_01100 [Pseudomonadota bacterium]